VCVCVLTDLHHVLEDIVRGMVLSEMLQAMALGAPRYSGVSRSFQFGKKGSGSLVSKGWGAGMQPSFVLSSC